MSRPPGASAQRWVMGKSGKAQAPGWPQRPPNCPVSLDPCLCRAGTGQPVAALIPLPPTRDAQWCGLRGRRFRSSSQWLCGVCTMGSLCAEPGRVPGQTGRLPAKGGAGRRAQGRRKAGATALVPGRLGGQDSPSAQAWRAHPHPLRPASKPPQHVPQGTPFPAQATLGWSFGPGRPRAVRAP